MFKSPVALAVICSILFLGEAATAAKVAGVWLLR